MHYFSQEDPSKVAELAMTDTPRKTSLKPEGRTKRRGSMIRSQVNELTLDGKLSKTGLSNYDGAIWYKFSENSPYVSCKASLCGPILQIEPLKKLTVFIHGAFEVDLTKYVEVGLEHIPVDPLESGLKFTLWKIILSTATSSSAAGDSVVTSAPKAQIIIHIQKQDEAVIWARELKRAVRDVENALSMQKSITTRELSDVVDMQLSTTSSSGGIHSLQNVTQVQRNVAILGLKGKHKAPPKASTHGAGRLLSNMNLLNNPDFFVHRQDEYEDMETTGKEVVSQAEYNRKHFIVKSRGSYYLFWGRIRIRLTFLVRMIAILVSYPFVVIYSVLDMEAIVSEVNRGLRKVEVLGVDISFFFKNARRFVVTANLTLLFLPIFLVYIALAFTFEYWNNSSTKTDWETNEKHALIVNRNMQATIILIVASYSAVFFMPIAIAIGRKNKATSDLTDVVDGTFCFRPHYKMRLFAKQPITFNLNTANLSTLGGIFIEFVLHSVYCLPKCQLKDCGVEDYQLPRENLMESIFFIKWRYLFWLLFAFTIFNASVFVLHGVLSGKKKFHLSNHFWLWQFVWVLNGPAFVSIVMTMFQAFGCVLTNDKKVDDDGNFDDEDNHFRFVLIEDTDMECFNREHKNVCVAAFVGLAIYLTQAALLPSGTYKETMRNKLFDILYVPAYLEGHFFLKALFAATYVLTFRAPDEMRITLLLSVNLALLLLNVRENPCAIVEINILRTATLSGTVWAGAASLLYVTQLKGLKDEDCNTNKGFLPLLFFTGWVMIFSGAAYIARNNSKAIDSVLAHTFLELERQVEEARKNALSGPLIGLDGRPLTIGGKEIEAHEALNDWPAYMTRLKAESSRLAIRAEANRVRQGSESFDSGRWGFASGRGRTNTPTMSGHGSDRRRSGWGRRISMVLGHVPESTVTETLTDEDLAEIHALNNKSKLGSVAPRVLEPLISLTLSDDPVELMYAAKYIRELVWCTSISYPRVQFQALWALANLSQKREVTLEDFQKNPSLMELAEEQRIVLEPGQNLGDKFRQLIVSTDYITRSVDDDAIDMMEKTAQEIGVNMVDDDEDLSVAHRRASRVELERDLSGLNRGTTKGLLSDAVISDGMARDRAFSHARQRSGSNLEAIGRARASSNAPNHTAPDLTNVGFRRRSTANNMRASLVNHAMADTARRLSVSGPALSLLSTEGSLERSSLSRERASTIEMRLGHSRERSSTDEIPMRANHSEERETFAEEVRDTVDMTYDYVQGIEETPKLVSRKSNISALFETVDAADESDHSEKKTEELKQQAPLPAVSRKIPEADPTDSLYEDDGVKIAIVDENVLGGLRVIYSGFRDMNETVKMEALAVMVNLSLNPEVADSLVFHQEGDTLAHILELIWAPGVFTKFATLVLVNLATTEQRRRVILRSGGLAAVIGLLLGSDYDLQVAACRALVNLALSPAPHVPLLGSSVFIERLLAKLAPVDHPETQRLVTYLVRNMCVRKEFARSLNNPQHKTFDRLKKLRDSSTSTKKESHDSDDESDEVGKLIMFTVNSLSEFKQKEEKTAEFMEKLPPFNPITAEVTWDTWNSKLDRMWNPVLSISPVAKGRHIHVPCNPYHQDIRLQAEDAHGSELKYRIVTKPLCGTLIKPEGEAKSSCVFRYTPFKGHTGVDYFTFVASNQVMDSNVGTVSIKVDRSLAEEQMRLEKEKVLKDKELEAAKKATLDMVIKSQIEPSISIRESKGGESKLASLLSFVKEDGEDDEEDGDEDAVKRRTGHLGKGDSDSDTDSILGLHERDTVRGGPEDMADSIDLPGMDDYDEDMRVTVDLSADMDLPLPPAFSTKDSGAI